jgi:mannose-6-phosphate isomerase-like protein (cupin superfamily)
MAEKERVLGGVGTAVLSENDRVKIWEMRLEPGEESDVHEHTMDYILVIIEGDRIAGDPEPDTKGHSKYIESEVYPGQIFYMKKGGIETARNTGEKTYYEILIELKD